MAPRKTAPKAVEVVVEDDTVDQSPEVEEAPAPAPVVTVTTATPLTKNVRVKGTWTMYWGGRVFDFVDGQRYELPVDLFEYLRSYGNIYDTM